MGPDDGSDTVEGQADTDTMVFNGSGAAEIFEVSANGARTRFTRNIGTIVMDLDDLEVIDVNALGNTDTAIVNDLSGTDVAKIDDQAGTLGGATGDGVADSVILNGTNNADSIDVFGAGTSVSVVGLTAQVNIANTPRGRTTPSPSTPWAATTASAPPRCPPA